MQIEFTHNMALVLLSYLVSVLGSFTALQLAVGIPNAKDSAQRWRGIIGAGGILGLGAIWSMHFIAMIAHQMNIPVTYDVGITAASAVVGAVACIVGFAIVGLGSFTFGKLIAAALFMGTGVAGMHYLGMTAMVMAATTHYSILVVVIAVTIAIVASGVALWLAFNMRGTMQMMVSAMVMGVAVCGMHYVAMLGSTFVKTFKATNAGQGIGGENLGLGIFAIATISIGVVLTLSMKRNDQRKALTI
jgi:NO-binding membrane sensor protein with MHYT domain